MMKGEGRYMKLRKLRVFISMVMLCFSVGLSVKSYDVVEASTKSSVSASGECGVKGAKVYWKLENGKLTISGTGAMKDFETVEDWDTGETISSVVAPWENYSDEIIEVEVQKGVTAVGYTAFADLYYLKKATIAGSVKEIGGNAFANDHSLEQVILNEGTVALYGDALYGTAVTEITLPSTLVDLSESTFAGAEKLKSIYVSSGNKVYSSIGGVLFKDKGKTLVCYPGAHGATYTIPSSVTKIASSAFSGSNITRIVIPNTVKSVGESAFDYCESLTSITFSKNQKVIEYGMCYYCTKLTSVTIPEGITSIDNSAFFCCDSLKKVTLPSTIKSVGQAFEDYTKVDTSKTTLTSLENGILINAVKIKIKAKECYKKAFEVLNLVNKERKKKRLDALKMDQSLLESAMKRGFETVLYWEHTRPSGYDCFSANSLMYGENIARGQKSSSGVMTSWMNSSGHKANILGDYESVGIGCVYYKGTYYWVQCFGKEAEKVAKSSSYKNKKKTRTVLVAKNSKYYKAKFSFKKTKLEVGESITPTVKWNGLALSNSGVTMSSSNKSVCKVVNGKLKAVGVGKTTVKIYYPTWKSKYKKYTITVSPKKTKITKAAKKGNKIQLSWKKISSAGGYEIQYGTDKKFKKGVITVKISKMKMTKKTLSKLKKKTTYYIRVCSFKKVSGKKYNSEWSKIKKIQL